MPQDILIVEDDKDTANQYGLVINRRLKIEPFVETSPRHALEIVAQNPIKVLVVDQKMPELTGTELVREVQKKHPDIVSIMLTGLATKAEVGEAVNLGFFRYIDKEDVTEELIPTIEDALRHYDLVAELREEYERLVGKEIGRIRGRWIIGRETLRISIQSVGQIEPNVIKENEWQTEFIARAGMKIEDVITFEVEQSYQLEQKFAVTQEVELGIANIIDGIKGAFQEMFGYELKERLGRKEKRAVERKISANLPIPDDPSQRHIKEIHYQATGPYNRITFVLAIHCSLCESDNTSNVAVYIPTAENATRQIIRYSDGKEEIHDWR